jgi:hypothetical protein
MQGKSSNNEFHLIMKNLCRTLVIITILIKSKTGARTGMNLIFGTCIGKRSIIYGRKR